MQIPGIPYTHGGLTVNIRIGPVVHTRLCIEWASARGQSFGRNGQRFSWNILHTPQAWYHSPYSY
jgi:hypothetical protein